MKDHKFLKNIPTWCISLNGKGDSRFKNARKTILDMGFSEPRRFDAIPGQKLSDKVIKTLLSPRAYNELKYGRHTHQAISGKGSIGCYLSHVKLWEQCIKNNEMIAVFEDDINVYPDAHKHLENAWKYLKTSNMLRMWNIFRIAYLYIPQMHREGKRIHENIIKDNYCPGLQGYLLSPQGARELLNGAFPINEHVDYYVNDHLATLADTGHYFLSPEIYKDLGHKSHVGHNDMCLYNMLDFEFIVWILVGIIVILWFVIMSKF